MCVEAFFALYTPGMGNTRLFFGQDPLGSPMSTLFNTQLNNKNIRKKKIRNKYIRGEKYGRHYIVLCQPRSKNSDNNNHPNQLHRGCCAYTTRNVLGCADIWSMDHLFFCPSVNMRRNGLMDFYSHRKVVFRIFKSIYKDGNRKHKVVAGGKTDFLNWK